jgi:hypothetical protein
MTLKIETGYFRIVILDEKDLSDFKSVFKNLVNPFYAIDSELFDFQQIRFSFGKTTEEATGKRKSKVIVQSFS